MQLSLPLSVPPTPGPAVEPATAPLPAEPVIFVRHRRARRYILRVLDDGAVRVTMPRWGVKREARAFVEASRSWIARQRARHSERRDIGSASALGGTVFVDGVAARIGLTEAGEISIARDEAVIATLDAAASVSAAVERWLRARASVELPAMLKALAAEHQISVTRVSVRNQRSRWGACSPSGTITLNWRLIQAPSFVREYVLLHELMHRREMNHSRRFWRLVAACCPRHAEARQWLRKEGKQLWSDSPSSSRR